jgi:hypothetical protein
MGEVRVMFFLPVDPVRNEVGHFAIQNATLDFLESGQFAGKTVKQATPMMGLFAGATTCTPSARKSKPQEARFKFAPTTPETPYFPLCWFTAMAAGEVLPYSSIWSG